MSAREPANSPDRAWRRHRGHGLGARRALAGGKQPTSNNARGFEGEPDDGRVAGRLSNRAVMLVGTNTEVGKTVTGLLLAGALARRGFKVAGMKPVESGCDPDPEDALGWAAVTGLDLSRVCPYRFRLPVAPQCAAEAEGRRVELDPIRRGLAELRREHDLVLVESAGGLGSPLAPGLLVLDLARALDLPVLLVAPHSLGSVGQVLVASRLLAHEGIECLGVVLSQQTEQGPGPEAATHAPLLREHGRGLPLLGILPYAGEMPSPADGAALRRWATVGAELAEGALDLDPIISRREAPETTAPGHEQVQ